MTTRNPENPFVKNQHHFLYSLPYDQTTFYWIHKISNLAAFFLGLLLATLLLFLIAFKTPPSFRPYSKMVFLCVLTDMIILVCDWICQARVKIANGVVILSYTGSISQLSYTGKCYGMIIQTFGATFAAAVLPLQYFYRYYTLKTRKSPTICQSILFYCVSTIFVCSFSILSAISYNIDPNDLPDYDYGTLWYEENPIPPLIIGSIKSKWMLIEISYLGVCLTGSYVFTIWLARQTIKELDSQEYELTERTKSLQRQFSMALLVQALTPLFTSLVPLAFAIFAMATETSTGYTGEFVILGITWFPAINCLSNIIFIVPYRRYCLRLLPGYDTRTASSTVQHSTVFVE